ncbi:hypothetical protein Tco_0319702 [Tanacetum coccineum]
MHSIRKTIRFDSLISILKLRGTTYMQLYSAIAADTAIAYFTINLQRAMEIISLLLNWKLILRARITHIITILFSFFTIVEKCSGLMLGLESQWPPLAVRCALVRGDLIYGHPQNLDVLASKSLGDERELDEMQKSFLFSCEKPAQPRKPLTRSNTNSMTQLEDPQFENEATDVNRNDDHPMLASMFDSQFVKFIKKLEAGIRDGIVRVYSQTKSNVSVVPAGLEQRKDENDRDYIKRFKIFTEKQCSEIQPGRSKLSVRNGSESMKKSGGTTQSPDISRSEGGSAESEGELNDLLVCIGDDTGVADDDDVEED